MLAMGVGREQQGTAVYYRFEDASGRLHIVDSLQAVPQALRPAAQRVAYSEQPSTAASLLQHGLSGWQTFALGFGAALLVVFVLKRLPGSMRFVLRLAIVGGLLTVLAGGYLGWVRRTSGLTNDALATPAKMLDDAKSAVAKLNAAQEAEQAQLKELEQVK